MVLQTARGRLFLHVMRILPNRLLRWSPEGLQNYKAYFDIVGFKLFYHQKSVQNISLFRSIPPTSAPLIHRLTNCSPYCPGSQFKNILQVVTGLGKPKDMIDFVLSSHVSSRCKCGNIFVPSQALRSCSRCQHSYSTFFIIKQFDIPSFLIFRYLQTLTRNNLRVITHVLQSYCKYSIPA